MDLIDRIKVVMKVNQLSATQLAEEIGVQRSNVSHVLSGRNKPSFEFLNKLLTRFPKVNAHWLITGQSQDVSGSPEMDAERREERQSKEAPARGVIGEPGGAIERIVVFYTDGTFRHYNSSTMD